MLILSVSKWKIHRLSVKFSFSIQFVSMLPFPSISLASPFYSIYSLSWINANLISSNCRKVQCFVCVITFYWDKIDFWFHVFINCFVFEKVINWKVWIKFLVILIELFASFNYVLIVYSIHSRNFIWFLSFLGNWSFNFEIKSF